MAFQRLKRLRTELSGNFDSQESAKLLGFRYDAGATANMPSNSPVDLETQDWVSNRPIVIHQYKIEVQTTVPAMLWQWYCDSEDSDICSNWDFVMGDGTASASSVFRAGLKQKRMVGGGAVGKAGPVESSQDYALWSNVHTLRFKSKGYYSKRHKEYRWKVPPIVLSANKKDTWGVSVANISSGSDNRSFIASMEVQNWHTVT